MPAAALTALPSIHHDFSASLTSLAWTINAYALAAAAGIITAAALGDRLGRKRVFSFGLGLFTIASVGCALAPTAGLLIAARALQGIGAAIVMPLSLTILTAAFPAERRGAVVGSGEGLASKEVTGWWVRPGVFDTREWIGDVRPGGRWRASGVGNGRPYTLEGEFLEVDPVRKISA